MLSTEKIYYSLRETEQETGVPVSTLRYWEKQFKELNPRKDGHGNRYYTRGDQELIKRIKYFCLRKSFFNQFLLNIPRPFIINQRLISHK